MTPKAWAMGVLCVSSLSVAACSSQPDNVQATAFVGESTETVISAEFDADVPWSCGGAHLQAVFAPSFPDRTLIDAVSSAIADPSKPEASFSFVSPIESFTTDFESRSLCLTLNESVEAESTKSLVRQLRATGNVIAVRAR